MTSSAARVNCDFTAFPVEDLDDEHGCAVYVKGSLAFVLTHKVL